MTNIWPSQYKEEPIPIVGILIFSVINFADDGNKHSKTIEKAPAFSIVCASFNNLYASFLFYPQFEIFF